MPDQRTTKVVILTVFAASTLAMMPAERILVVVLGSAPALCAIRARCEASLSAVAWGLAGAIVPISAGAFAWLRRRQATSKGSGWESLTVAASVVQTPALVAVVMGVLGARTLPVLSAVVLATAGVLVLGVTLVRSKLTPRPY